MRYAIAATLLVLTSFAHAAPYLQGTWVEPGPSRAAACKPEILATKLGNPVHLAVGPGGKVYAVDASLIDKHVTRVLAVGRPSVEIARIPGAYRAVLVGGRMVLHGNDDIVIVELATGVQTRVAKKVSTLAARGETLYAIIVGATRSQLVELALPGLAEKPVATIRGKWDVSSGLAAGATELFALMQPDPFENLTRAFTDTHLQRITLATGAVAEVGQIRLGGELAVSAKHGYVGSLSTVTRVGASGAVEIARLGGADDLAADDAGAAWVLAEHQRISLWPTGGAPVIACEDIGDAAAIALTPTHAYYMTVPKQITEFTAVVGRVKR